MAELHFCTVCGVSVPQAELDSGRAVQGGERSACPDCLEVLGLSGGRSASGSGTSGLIALALAVVAIGAAGWTWWTADQQQVQLRADTRGAFDEQALAYEGVLERKIDEVLAAISRESGLTAAQLDGLNDRLLELEQATQARLRELQTETEQLGQLTLEIEALGRRLGKSEAELTLATERLSEQRSVQGAMRDRLDTLEATQLDLAQRAPAASDGDAGADDFTPQVAGLVRQLRSSDQDERLDALEKIAGQEDPRLVPHLLPLLTDPYEFNRFYAAKTLGDWRSKPAVPHLIESLQDEIGFVRQAAVQSLRFITGQNFRFAHDGAEQERLSAYQAWKTWWNANGKSFLET